MLNINQASRSECVIKKKYFVLFLNQNICCEYLKEPCCWDGIYEHPKHMFKLMSTKQMTILHSINFNI